MADQAGYSGTPLAKKLGIKEGHTLLLVAAPAGWDVPDLPDDVEILRRSTGPRTGDLGADVVIAFFAEATRFNNAGPSIARRLAAGSALWIAWPRRAGGHESDMTERLIRDELLAVGVVDVKVAALDQDWSGLKFVWRRQKPQAIPSA